jgi:hypothetical protein
MPTSRWSLSAGLAERYRAVAAVRGYWVTSLCAILALAGSIWVSLLAGQYSVAHASNSVSDIVLSNVPAFNLDDLFVYGTLVFAAFVFIVALTYPRRLPFMFFTLALFYLIRAGFVTLTHIAPFPERTAVDFGETIKRYFFGADLFFSGHTGTPFLLALVFWQDKSLRYLFIGCSLFFACIVLLAHLHYSIDVASAFFISYAIYHLALQAFPWSARLFAGTNSV